MDRGSGWTSPWEYADFELEIRQGTGRNYPIAVRSPAGEAREQMRFPFDRWELENKLLTLENALLRSGGARRRRVPSEEEKIIQEFGQSLLQALLVGEVRTRYAMSLREARRQSKGLRLKLRIEPPELARLPWEFLYDADRDSYLSLSSRTPLIRYLDLPEPVERLSVSPPLRILGMVASPLDLDPLDVEHEKRLAEEAIKDLRADGLIELIWLEGHTWRDLQRAMRRGPWHIFHFIGHGGFDSATDEGAIALADELGRKYLLGATGMAGLLDGHYPLRLVVLNSCEGARGGDSDAFSSTAATLVRRGIPAVLAMQYEITDEAAIAFSRDFYQAVADGLPLDAAVSEARKAVSYSLYNTLEWGTPVLYMRSEDGRIFDISSQTPPVDTAQEDEREEQERRYRLEELYERARRSHRAREWQAVIEAFDQIREIDPEYPDPEGFLVSAREALAAERQERRAATLYDQGLRHIEAEEWPQALQCFQEVQRLEPHYQNTEALLSQVRHELEDAARADAALRPTVRVPDLTGQPLAQAGSMLADAGLTLGDRKEASSETIADGEIIEQTPVAGTETEPGSSVSVTVSKGPSLVEVPDVRGQSHSEASSSLAAVGLRLGRQYKVSNSKVPEGKVAKQHPGAGTKVEQGSSIWVTVSSGPSAVRIPDLPSAVRIPDLIGKNASEASRTLVDMGLTLSHQNEAPSEVVPEGEIIEQTPEAGTEVKPGSLVSVTVSLGVEEPQTRSWLSSWMKPRRRSAKVKVTILEESIRAMHVRDPVLDMWSKVSDSVSERFPNRRNIRSEVTRLYIPLRLENHNPDVDVTLRDLAIRDRGSQTNLKQPFLRDSDLRAWGIARDTLFNVVGEGKDVTVRKSDVREVGIMIEEKGIHRDQYNLEITFRDNVLNGYHLNLPIAVAEYSSWKSETSE
jgi:beta-lactam-binding protein with PASTA domain